MIALVIKMIAFKKEEILRSQQSVIACSSKIDCLAITWKLSRPRINICDLDLTLFIHKNVSWLDIP